MRRDLKDLWKEDKRCSEFDERGIPTHEFKKEREVESKSKPINDKLKKKLEKEWNEQQKLYTQWQ